MENEKTQVNASLELTLTTILTNALEKTKESYPTMLAKAERAKMALATIVKIENDEEDALANNMMVKSNKTYDEIKAMREEITKPLDAIKVSLMEPEKVVSVEKAHEQISASIRIKKLRDSYATAKAQKLAEEQRKLQADKDKKDEESRLRALFTNRFYEAVLSRVAQLRVDINTYYTSITLEDFETKQKRFSLKPNLKPADFESWFIVDYDKTKFPTADFEAFLSKVKAQYTYEAINETYILQAQPVVDEYKAKLPALKIKLTEEAQIAAQDAEKAKQLADARIKEQNQEVEAKNEEIAESIKTNQEETLREQQTEQLNNEFDLQVGTQSLDTLSGTIKKKIARINCPPAKIVEVLSRVLFANYQNPSFPGHYKRDRTTKEITKDDAGNPVLADWADFLLSFYANNCSDAKIDGIEVVEALVAVNKSK